jgi:hypothetical protein
MAMRTAAFSRHRLPSRSLAFTALVVSTLLRGSLGLPPVAFSLAVRVVCLSSFADGGGDIHHSMDRRGHYFGYGMRDGGDDPGLPFGRGLSRQKTEHREGARDEHQ